MRHATAFVVLTVFLGICIPPCTAQSSPPNMEQGRVGSNAEAALAAYQEGKKDYDRKDYLAARKKFSEAARSEPDNPRWHYNLGLVYRQLDNFQASRLAFMRVRDLDPDYKRSEIDQKLKSMGFSPDAPATSQPASRNALKKEASPPLVNREQSAEKPVLPAPSPASAQSEYPKDSPGVFGWVFSLICCFGLPLFVIVAIVMLLRRIFRKKNAVPEQASATAFDPQQLAQEESRLTDVAIRLTRIEHVMRLGEHPDLRNLLEHATRNEQAAWKALNKVRDGDRSAFGQLQRTTNEASTASQRELDLANELYGDQAFTGQGERIGCFFCARPLANPDYRRRLTLKRGDSQDEVIACPDCAAQTERGESPTIRTGADGRTHWSEIPDYDPYAMRHGAQQTRQVEAWRYEPQQPMSHLSQLAAGGALLGVGALAGAGVGVAMAASSFFDLDAARHSGLSHEALSESAFQASGRRRHEPDYDHS